MDSGCEISFVLLNQVAFRIVLTFMFLCVVEPFLFGSDRSYFLDGV